MPLTTDQIAEQAAAHDAAEIGGMPIRTFSQDRTMDLDDAYAVQNAWIARKVARGRRVIGRKVGLTSRTMQHAMKIGEPDFGTLLDDMLFQSGDTIPAADFIDPRLEVEWTFVLKHNLSGPDMTVDDVMAATNYILPSLELIAARSYRVDPETGYTRLVTDTISDNAANAGIIVGADKIAPEDIDLRWAGSILYRNNIVEETGLGAGVMGHPAEGLVWLAKRFSPHGIELEAGHYLMSGSFTRPVIARAGDEFVADFGPYGKVELAFS